MKSAQSLPAGQEKQKKLRTIKPKPGEAWYIKSDPEALKITVKSDDVLLCGRDEFEAYVQEKRKRLGMI